MRISGVFLISVLMTAGAVLGAAELDFSKKRNYFIGEGEYGSITLQLLSAETYNYEEGISRPFVMKKLNDDGLLQIIFDARTLEASALKDGETMTTSFVFTKKNIGKKELLNVSAIYRPEVRIITPDSLYMDFIKLDFTPQNKTAVVRINALRKIQNMIIEDPGNILTFGDQDRLVLEKGVNEITVTLNREENFSSEVVTYRKLSEGKINQLYFLVTAKDFKAVSVDAEADNVSEEEIRNMMLEDSLENANIYAGLNEAASGGGNGEGGMFSLVSIVIIAVLALSVLVLLVMLMLKKKDPLLDTYQTFYDDVATLLKVPTKGVNLDKSIEEIMILLLEKFEYGSAAASESKPKTEQKRVLKKPAGVQAPANAPSEAGPGSNEDYGTIDLSFDPGKDEAEPRTEEKKISRGFDFLDED